MRKLFCLAFLTANSWGAVAFVQSTMCSSLPDFGLGNTVTCTFGSTPAAGNTIIASFQSQFTPSSSIPLTLTGVSDNKGNTYSSVNSVSNSGIYLTVFVASNISSSATFTVTWTVSTSAASPQTPAIAVSAAEYSGVTGSVDSTSSAVALTTSSTVACGTATTANANDLLFLSGGSDIGLTAVSAGFTLRQRNSSPNDNYHGIADDIVSVTGTYSPTFTRTGSSNFNQVCILAAFQATSTASRKLLKSIN